MFAALVFEREPLQWSDLAPALEAWFQDVGGLAAVCLAVWGVTYLVGPGRASATCPRRNRKRQPAPGRKEAIE